MCLTICVLLPFPSRWLARVQLATKRDFAMIHYQTTPWRAVDGHAPLDMVHPVNKTAPSQGRELLAILRSRVAHVGATF